MKQNSTNSPYAVKHSLCFIDGDKTKMQITIIEIKNPPDMLAARAPPFSYDDDQKKYDHAKEKNT